jgi:hypothetical protein
MTAATARSESRGPGAGVAGAEPPPPCDFTLSPPEVVRVNGASMVTSTVAPDVCIVPPAGPSLNVACLELLGVDTGGTCRDATSGPLLARGTKQLSQSRVERLFRLRATPCGQGSTNHHAGFTPAAHALEQVPRLLTALSYLAVSYLLANSRTFGIGCTTT